MLCRKEGNGYCARVHVSEHGIQTGFTRRAIFKHPLDFMHLHVLLGSNNEEK